MKRLALLATSALTLAVSSATFAQDKPSYENWVGGFAQYYNADDSKPLPNGGLEDGKGLGGEVGFRFDPNWALRFELSRINLDSDGNNPFAADDDGTMLGADIMYFMDDSPFYFFTGLREQSLTESYRMASLGFGKHWQTSSNWIVMTELAGYHDFGQNFNELSAKLGVAYTFGEQAAPMAAKVDSDNDGVEDALDRCPATPQGVSVDATGCALDSDGDGVLNAQDRCPGTPRGDIVDAMGCSIKDSDNDGVIDANDSCPNTASGAEVNGRGCAIELDSDGDGVLDSQDKCLGTPTTDKVDLDGCSIFESEEVSFTLDILFANNSSAISNPDSARIQQFAEFMKRFPNTQAVIEGHTSAVGSAEYNQFLSEKRAQSALNLFVSEYGIDASRLQAIGYGETRLKNTANTAEAHRVNRRIEAKVSAIVERKVTKN